MSAAKNAAHLTEGWSVDFETPEQRVARITKRANEARPRVSMSPGQAATLRSLHRRRLPWRWLP